MTAPVSVIELTKRFGEQIEAYKSGKYNEVDPIVWTVICRA
ncbi:MAG: hypothetical protein ACRETQ_06010 [Gammaproteobacteria bacterium]